MTASARSLPLTAFGFVLPLTAFGFVLAMALPCRATLANAAPPERAHPDTLGWVEHEPDATEDAEDAEDKWWDPPEPAMHFVDRPVSLAAMLGVGSPVGFIGVTGEYSVLERVGVGAGFGTNARGLQLAANVNLRPFVWNRSGAAHALSSLVSYSTGPWEAFHISVSGLDHRGPEIRRLDHHYVNDRAHWLQFDVAYELRTRGGFVFRAGYGTGWMLNPGDATCERGDGTPVVCNAEGDLVGFRPDDALYVFDVSFGYAF